MHPKKRIKILFVITKGVWGGAQKYVYTLATNLSKDKYDVAVVCGEGKILKQKLEEKGVRVYEIANLKRNISLVAEIKSSLKLLQIVWREHPDVLHLNSPKAGGFGAVAGRLALVPTIIYTAHGWTFNEERNFLARGVIWFFSWITALLCTKIIVIAKREKEQALKMPGISNKSVVLIRNGVEKVDHINRSIVREALLGRVDGRKPKPGTLWLGTIAELHKNKGLEHAITALSKIESPFVFFIIGGGEEKERLQSLIEKLGLQNKVFLVGFVEDAVLYLKAFDIFLLTSVKEGLPYTVIEAGFAGLPVIASHVGGIPDILDDGVHGILTRKADIAQIVKAVTYLISNPEKQKEFGKALKEKVEKEFSVEKMVDKTIKLYSI